MIDLTLSSDDESPRKRRRVPFSEPQLEQQLPRAGSAPQVGALPGTSGLGAGGFPPLPKANKRYGPGDLGWETATTQDLNDALEGLNGMCFPVHHNYKGDDATVRADGGPDTGGDSDPHPSREGRGGNGAGDGGNGHGRPPGGRRGKDNEEDGEPDGSGSDDGVAAVPRKKPTGGRKRLTAEEREERDRAKAAERAAKAAKREAMAAEKAAEKQRKEAAKEELKRSKAAQKEAAKEQKEVHHALKVSMVGRYMRLLLSNTLAASPLGMKIVEHIPLVRESKEGQTFPHEVHRDMALAARGYRYCMWGVRLPAAAAARLRAAEGCALEASELPEPSGKNLPLMLFPAVLLVLTGDELLLRLEADPLAPLAGLYGDVVRAYPSASLLIYVIGLAEALKRRERANKSFNRHAVEDLLFDVAVGMPAVRLQYDCPETDLARAAVHILNLGYAMSQLPRKKLEAYLDTFGSKSTAPLRTIKEVLSQQGGQEQLILCEALSQLVAPQRAAAVAAEFPSLAAIIEALRSKPEGRAREALLAKCRIPGVVPVKGKQLVAGPAAASSLVRFLLTQKGREEWQDVDE